MTRTWESFALNDGFEEKIHAMQTAEYAIYRESLQARRAGDSKREDEVLHRLVENNLAIRSAMKAEAQRFTALTKFKAGMDDDQKAERLLEAFLRGVRIAKLWRDFIMENRISQHHGNRLATSVRPALATLGRLDDLAIFLDHPDLSVRATTAAWLVARLPDKCVPVLEDVQARSHITLDAGLTAFAALQVWKRDEEISGGNDA